MLVETSYFRGVINPKTNLIWKYFMGNEQELNLSKIIGWALKWTYEFEVPLYVYAYVYVSLITPNRQIHNFRLISVKLL